MMMPAGEYRAWVCETGRRTRMSRIVAGAGMTLLKWPPGPCPLRSDRVAFVYNVYTEPPHRAGASRGA